MVENLKVDDDFIQKMEQLGFVRKTEEPAKPESEMTTSERISSGLKDMSGLRQRATSEL